jgi:hypothetical protein
MSGFSKKLSISGSTRIVLSSGSLILHFICMSLTKSAPTNVTISHVLFPLLYQSFMPSKKEIRFVRVTRMPIEILFLVTCTMALFSMMGSLFFSKPAISSYPLMWMPN